MNRIFEYRVPINYRLDDKHEQLRKFFTKNFLKYSKSSFDRMMSLNGDDYETIILPPLLKYKWVRENCKDSLTGAINQIFRRELCYQLRKINKERVDRPSSGQSRSFSGSQNEIDLLNDVFKRCNIKSEIVNTKFDLRIGRNGRFLKLMEILENIDSIERGYYTDEIHVETNFTKHDIKLTKKNGDYMFIEVKKYGSSNVLGKHIMLSELKKIATKESLKQLIDSYNRTHNESLFSNIPLSSLPLEFNKQENEEEADKVRYYYNSRIWRLFKLISREIKKSVKDDIQGDSYGIYFFDKQDVGFLIKSEDINYYTSDLTGRKVDGFLNDIPSNWPKQWGLIRFTFWMQIPADATRWVWNGKNFITQQYADENGYEFDPNYGFFVIK